MLCVLTGCILAGSLKCWMTTSYLLVNVIPKIGITFVSRPNVPVKDKFEHPGKIDLNRLWLAGSTLKPMHVLRSIKLSYTIVQFSNLWISCKNGILQLWVVVLLYSNRIVKCHVCIDMIHVPLSSKVVVGQDNANLCTCNPWHVNYLFLFLWTRHVPTHAPSSRLRLIHTTQSHLCAPH